MQKSFTTISTVKILINEDTKKEVSILKVKKDGTKRIFFKPVVNVDGNEVGVTSTLWARLSEAERVAKAYLTIKPKN